MKEERLQKVLAQRGLASRRQSEELIKSGRVKVNGKIVTEMGVKVDPERVRISVDGAPVANAAAAVYLLLHKPKGFVTTTKDPDGRATVLDLLKGQIKQRVYPVGRLDYNSEGLILLTNDGTLTELLIHPRHQIEKIYKVKVKGFPTEDSLDRMRIGMTLENGEKTAPCAIHLRERDLKKECTILEIILKEGKNRQIRRMFDMIHHPVMTLKRVQFGFLTLEGVRRGAFRELTAQEVARLYDMAKPGSTDRPKTNRGVDA